MTTPFKQYDVPPGYIWVKTTQGGSPVFRKRFEVRVNEKYRKVRNVGWCVEVSPGWFGWAAVLFDHYGHDRDTVNGFTAPEGAAAAMELQLSELLGKHNAQLVLK